MIRAAILLTLGLMAGQPETGDADRYVPATGWQDNESDSAFFERWYGNQLRAMNERPLSAAADFERLRRSFRLLVLPNSDPGFAYRIDVRADGNAMLRWVSLNGAGGYAPGTIEEEGTRALRPRELQIFAAALHEAALGSREREAELNDSVTNPDGTQTFTICLHATRYVFEQVDEAGRQFVHRPSCYLEEPLERLVRALYRLNPPRGTNRAH